MSLAAMRALLIFSCLATICYARMAPKVPEDDPYPWFDTWLIAHLLLIVDHAPTQAGPTEGEADSTRESAGNSGVP